jgi:hypothetical protein
MALQPKHNGFWATRKPQHGFWFELSTTRLLKLYQRLMKNCSTPLEIEFGYNQWNSYGLFLLLNMVQYVFIIL